ncbi:hypothetical protein K0M31_012178 [Melipona bicolor]|uniref:Uncharacterized protein n=1 Tax=Melipona bicolor TaxID=60889 RepID=A0AA40FK34_9HYME|nr:hypothetical protein K0M31_012178 [Melipona bicolor]
MEHSTAATEEEKKKKKGNGIETKVNRGPELEFNIEKRLTGKPAWKQRGRVVRASNRKTFRRDGQQESNKLDTTAASKENGVQNSSCARRQRNEVSYVAHTGEKPRPGNVTLDREGQRERPE